MNQIPISILLKELRGNKSQMEMSQELGYRFNQYFKWESGSTALSLQSFIDLCYHLNIDIDNLFSELLHFSLENFEQSIMLSELYLKWFSFSEDYFLESIGFSKAKWWRLKHEKTKLSFNDFLEFIEVIANKKHAFLFSVSNDFRKKKYLHKTRNETTLLETIRLFPEFATIYSSLFLHEFSKAQSNNERKKILAKHVGIENTKLDLILKHLKKNKILNLDNQELEQPYKVALSRINMDINDILAKYCLNRNVEKLSKVKERSSIIATPSFAAVSEETELKINKIMTKCWSEITQAISEDDNSKKTKVLHIYLGKVD